MEPTSWNKDGLEEIVTYNQEQMYITTDKPFFVSDNGNFMIHWDLGEEIMEEVKQMKDPLRVAALFGPLSLCIFSILPAWNCTALLRSPTYLYFSGWSTPVGGGLIMSSILVGMWLTMLTGIGCKCCPCPNPVSLYGPVRRRLGLIPSEAYVMLVLAFFLMMIWRAVPIIYIDGMAAAVSWFLSFFYFFRLLCFSTDAAATILACLVTIIGLYILSLNAFFASSRRTDVKPMTRWLYQLFGCFLLIMGVVLILLSVPISFESHRAYTEITVSGEIGERTYNLFVTSQALQALRQSNGCKELTTVENCVGFQHTKYTRLLKTMEFELKCAGFCYNATQVKTFMLEPTTTISPWTDYIAPAPVDLFDAPVDPLLPPTLFSIVNYQAACDSSAARLMQGFVEPIGIQIYYQGIVLTVGALLLLLTQCFVSDEGDDSDSSDDDKEAAKKLGAPMRAAEPMGYGSMQ